MNITIIVDITIDITITMYITINFTIDITILNDNQHPQHFPHSTYSPPISSPAPTVSNNNNPSPAKSEPPQEPPGTQQSHPSSPGGFKQWAPSPSADLLAPFHSYDQHQAAQNLNYYMYLQSQVHISF